MSNQQKRQESVRGVTGTSRTYEGDWIALFDGDAVAAGAFDDRLRAWINEAIGTSHANINDAQLAYAVNQGFTTWNETGTISPVAYGVLTETGDYLIAESGDYLKKE